MPVFRMLNPVRDYAWGDCEFIPRLLGKEPVPGSPVAELWMGSHPSAPSLIRTPEGDVSLLDYLRQHPLAGFGSVSDREGLPFLMKVLAAAKPLSIQAHPSRESAKLGFQRENSLGVPLDSPRRNYRDPNHKPELICALTPFRALCGFRAYDEVISLFRKLGLDSQISSFEQLSRFSDFRAFQKFIVQLLSYPSEKAAPLLENYESALREGRLGEEALTNACLSLCSSYPQDMGALAPLYLRYFQLAPGEALYLGAGILHAYLEGAGIEIMANSDNVLRGGLTPKHVDVPELTAILGFDPYPGGIIQPQANGEGSMAYPCPAEEFELLRVQVNGVDTYGLQSKPAILLCDIGEALIEADGGGIAVKKGESLFAADISSLIIKGNCGLWMATVPSAQN